MSVLIKGMKMPKEKGPHKIEIRLFVREDGTAGLWGTEIYIQHEPLDVIPVPPHGRLIDADVLVKVLKRRSEDEWNKKTAPFSWSDAYECVMGTVDVMPTVIEAEPLGNSEQLPSAQPEQRWIPCSERLPEEDTEVLISYRYKEGEGDTDHVNIDITSYGTTCFGGREIHTLKEWRQPFDYFHANYEVIAWMPLPEPYKEEKHETD